MLIADNDYDKIRCRVIYMIITQIGTSVSVENPFKFNLENLRKTDKENYMSMNSLRIYFLLM